MTIAIAIVGRAITLWRAIKKRSKNIKSDSLTRSNREKSNIFIASLNNVIAY